MPDFKMHWYGDQVLTAIRKQNPEALEELAQEIYDASQRYVPVDTGTLKNSGYISSTRGSTYKQSKRHKKEVKAPNDNVVVLAYSAIHSHLVEYGTSKQPGVPYLRPALDESGDRGAQAYAKKMQESTDKIAIRRKKK